MNILLLEFVDELDSFLEFCQSNDLDSSEFTLVSFQPKVRALCKEKNLQCLDTRSFFDNDSHKRALEKSNALTQLMADQLNVNTDSPVNQTLIDTFIYYGRFYLNNYLRVLEVLRGIKETYKDKDIEIYALDSYCSQAPIPGTAPAVIPGRQSPVPSTAQPFLVNRDRFLLALVQEFCKVNDFQCHAIPATVPLKSPPFPEPSNVPGFLKTFAAALLRRKLRRLNKQRVIFLAALSYNLDRLFDDIQQRFPDSRCVTVHPSAMSTKGYIKYCIKELIHVISKGENKQPVTSIPLDVPQPPDTHPDKGIQNVAQQLETAYDAFMARHHAQFIYEACSFAAVLSQKVKPDLLGYLVQLHDQSFIQQEILTHLEPNLLLSPVSIDMFQSWGELCQKCDIPAAVIPQKGLVAPQDPYARMEEFYIGRAQVTESFKYAVAQTPYVRDYLTWANYKGTIIETGNLIFSRLHQANHNHDSKAQELRRQLGVEAEQQVIVYAPSMKSRKSHRFYVLETLDELIESIGDVMTTVSKMPDVHLVIRIHPGEPITRKEIRTLLQLPYNVSVSDQGTFEEVLSIASLLISFSSTSIQESLLNGVPVLLYDRWQRYNHLDAPEVTQGQDVKPAAAYYVSNPELLQATIGGIITHRTEGRIDASLFMDSIFPARYSENFFKLLQDQK